MLKSLTRRGEEQKKLIVPQDCQRRLIPKANRHHLPRQADWRQGHKRQGQGHNGGLNGPRGARGLGEKGEPVRIIGCGWDDREAKKIKHLKHTQQRRNQKKKKRLNSPTPVFFFFFKSSVCFAGFFLLYTLRGYSGFDSSGPQKWGGTGRCSVFAAVLFFERGATVLLLAMACMCMRWAGERTASGICMSIAREI